MKKITKAAKRGSQRDVTLKRQLWLMRWLAHEARWIPTLELAARMYGTGRTPRRLLHRDLRALQRAGVPVEGGEGRWRLGRRAFTTWLRALR